MSTAAISDIHSNIEALQTVLERIKALEVDEIVCLGDIVGYNASPNECIDILRNENATCILGNHDASAADIEEPSEFNPPARAAVLWTREELTKESRRFLANLRRELQVRDFYLFHGSSHETDRYIFSRENAADNFQLLAGLPAAISIGFFGHTHVRAAFDERRGIVTVLSMPEELALSPYIKYLINPGSVGQPRDGDPRASFLVYDDLDRRVVFHRVAYNIRACQDKIIRSGLPSQLAERLDYGW